MPNDDQASADLKADVKVDDPLDASNDPTPGATELAKYQQSIEGLADSHFIEKDGSTPPVAEKDPEPEEKEQDQEASDGETEEAEDTEDEQSEVTETAEDEEEEPEDQAVSANKSGKYRIRPVDSVDEEALKLRKLHPEWTLEKCVSKAKILLDVEDAKPEKAQESTEPARTSADVENEIEGLMDQRQKAAEDLDFNEQARLDREILKLTRESIKLENAEQQQKAAKEQETERKLQSDYEASGNKAVSFYPDASDPESPLTLRMIEIDQRMKRLNDPIFHSPNKPFILAQEAAKELGIPMKDPNARAPKATAKAPARPVKPARGNASTSPTAATTKVEEQMAGISSLQGYEDFVGRF